MIIGIIPARYNSQRFLGKPLIDIAGKTMIERVYEQANKSLLLTKVVVATDDERIFRHCEQKNMEVVLTAAHHESGTDRCAEAVEKIFAQTNELKQAIVVNIQGDEPLIEPAQIEELITVFENEKVEIASLVRSINDAEMAENPNIVKATFANNGKALYFSRSVIPFQRNKDTETQYYQHVGMYAFRLGTLQSLVKLPVSSLENTEKLEQLRWLQNGFDIYLQVTKFETHAIDTPEDYERIKRLF